MGKRKYTYNETVFENIDTKEKAYYHGLLRADGHVSKNCIKLEVSIKDEEIVHNIKKFFEVNNLFGDEIIKYRSKNKDKWHTKDKIYKYCSIQINSKKLVNDYFKHLNSTKKSEARLPRFDNEEVTFAWIKGYYDGDGAEDTPRLFSYSELLLDDIAEFLNIPYKTTCVKKNCYQLYIGAIAWNKLSLNYPYGLKRKNKMEVNKNMCGEKKDLSFLTYDILDSLVKTHSQAEIGMMFDISRKSVYSKCRSLGVKIPKRNGGKYNRKKVKKECLYYPCHDCKFESCEWCYCILYNFECDGNYNMLPNDIKDCSNCCIPHTNPEYIHNKYEELKVEI